MDRTNNKMGFEPIHRLFLRRSRALASPQEFSVGHFEDCGEAQDPIGGEVKLAALVSGDDDLDDVDALDEFALAPSTQGAEVVGTWSEPLLVPVSRLELQPGPCGYGLSEGMVCRQPG